MVELPFVKDGFLKKQSAEKSREPQEALKNSGAEAKSEKLRAQVLGRIVQRYQDYIEERETKTISELKALIQPYNQAVTKAKQQIAESFHPYIYSENFDAASDAAIALVARLETVQLPLNFWLSFEDMEEIGAGDEVGKAVFLCSLLRSLDSADAKVCICRSKKPYVIFSSASASYLCDIQKGTKSALIGSLGDGKIGDEQIVYMFSDSAYEDFTEAE